MAPTTAQKPPAHRALAALYLLIQGCADVTVVSCADHEARPDAPPPMDAAPFPDGGDPLRADAAVDRASPDDARADTADPPPSSNGCVPLPHCRVGYLCPPEPTTTPVLRDAPSAPPELTEVVATRVSDAVTVSAVGTDVNGDAATLTVDALNDLGQPVTPASITYGDHSQQGVRFRRTMSLRGLGIHRVRVTVSDIAGHSASRVVQVLPMPILGDGAACDFLGVLNRCFAGGVCRPVTNAGAPRCVRGTPPIILSAEILHNAIDGRAEMRIALQEVDHGQVFFSLIAFDHTGTRRPEFEPPQEVVLGSLRLRPADRAVCESTVRWSLAGHYTVQIADLRATPPSAIRYVARLRDEEGMITEVRDFTVRPTITVGEGERCDPNWVEQRCDQAAGLACVRSTCGGDPGCRDHRCARPTWTCPGASLIVDLNALPVAAAVDTWRTEGTIGDTRSLGQVMCMLNETLRDHVHRFRAPRAGRWRFAATVREGAVQLGAVASCGDPAWGNVHFCTSGDMAATQDYTLRAGEEVIVSVARSPLDTDRAYALTVSAAP
jgi:hypothetical protein